MNVHYNDRVLVVEDIHGKYEDDIQFTAYYLDTSEDADDAAIEYIQRECYDALYEHWFDNKIGEAEYSYERDR